MVAATDWRAKDQIGLGGLPCGSGRRTLRPDTPHRSASQPSSAPDTRSIVRRVASDNAYAADDGDLWRTSARACIARAHRNIDAKRSRLQIRDCCEDPLDERFELHVAKGLDPVGHHDAGRDWRRLPAPQGITVVEGSTLSTHRRPGGDPSPHNSRRGHHHAANEHGNRVNESHGRQCRLM
jgi:hypothetical protein